MFRRFGLLISLVALCAMLTGISSVAAGAPNDNGGGGASPKIAAAAWARPLGHTPSLRRTTPG